jgi:polysaccharide deacetylase 2 family uncharacterized protein YibQ
VGHRPATGKPVIRHLPEEVSYAIMPRHAHPSLAQDRANAIGRNWTVLYITACPQDGRRIRKKTMAKGNTAVLAVRTINVA